MEFRDLKRQYNALEKEINRSILEVLNSTNFISGMQVKELEEKLADYVGVKHCVTCGNGTDALTMVLKAWGISKGDAVFVPDFTFFASAEVVSFEGAEPIFYDVDIDTYNAKPESLEKAIEKVREEGRLNLKAVIAVDLFGQPADYEKISKIAKKYNMFVLEDGAQGFGGKIGNKRACSFGDAATTSFFPAKPLGCYGDGGAIFVNDDKMAEYLRSLAVHGKGEFKYDNVRIGWNSRLDTIQAAILLEKFKAFELYEIEEVNRKAAYYNQLLENIVKIPVIKDNFYSSWAQYTIQLPTEEARTNVYNHLKEVGIPSMIYYPKTMSDQKAFEYSKKYIECPVAKRLCHTVLSLPMHPYLEREEIESIVGVIRRSIQ